MRKFAALAAFAAGSNALVGRTDSCCFHLSSSGGASGKLGQLGDGQNRIGDDSLQPAQYCIDSNGAITDSNGRGCILTPPTTQLQCDEGVPPTPGFSVNSQGQLQYQSSPDFVACATGQNGGLNIYTTPNKMDVTGCVNVQLSADACSSSGAGGGGGAPAPAPQPSPAGPGPGPAGPGGGGGGPGPGPGGPGAGGGGGGPGPGPAGPGGGGGGPGPGAGGGGGGPGPGPAPAPSCPPAPSAPQTVTVTVTDCSCPTSGAPGGGGGGVVPQPSASMPGPSGGAGIKPSGTQPAPEGGGGGASQPGPSPSAPGPGGGGASQPGPSPSAPAPGGGGATQPGASPSTSAPSGAVTKPSVTQPTPGGGGASQPGTSHSVSATGGGGTSQLGTSHSVPATSGGGGGGGISVSVPPISISASHPTGSASASVPATSSSAQPSKTGTTGGACPTDLSGPYEIPHLIVNVDSSSPGTTAGTGFNGTVSSTMSTVFNFDIPSSDAGKTCSLIFLFPRLEDLETSSYSFSGDGKIDFAKLSSVADSSTNFGNMPSVSQDLGTITVSPGNSYLVSTFSCPAGQAVAYVMKNAGSTDFNFFEDWNPSPLGLYITTC